MSNRASSIIIKSYSTLLSNQKVIICLTNQYNNASIEQRYLVLIAVRGKKIFKAKKLNITSKVIITCECCSQSSDRNKHINLSDESKLLMNISRRPQMSEHCSWSKTESEDWYDPKTRGNVEHRFVASRSTKKKDFFYQGNAKARGNGNNRNVMINPSRCLLDLRQ